MKISRFEEIECWQQARILVKYVYQATAGEAFRKDLRLTGQVRAAGVSAMSNTAEGFTRRSNREFIQFLFISLSSTAEVQRQLYVAFDLGYISDDSFQRIYDQAGTTARLISNFIKYLAENEKRWSQVKKPRESAVSQRNQTNQRN
jgi:four helix bundle protein